VVAVVVVLVVLAQMGLSQAEVLLVVLAWLTVSAVQASLMRLVGVLQVQE
jgi:hypothetical protein